MPAHTHVSYSTDGEKWKTTDDVVKAIDLRIAKLDPLDAWSRSVARRVRSAVEEGREADGIRLVQGLFVAFKQSHHLPGEQVPGGSADDVRWLRRFLQRLKPDAHGLAWTLQEESRIPPHGAFLFMVLLAGVEVTSAAPRRAPAEAARGDRRLAPRRE